MLKAISKLLAVAAVIGLMSPPTYARNAERADISDITRRVEVSNPGFVPILTYENGNAGNSLTLSTGKAGSAGSISVVKKAHEGADLSDVPVLYGCVLSSQPSPETGAKRSVAMYSFKDDVFTQKNSGTKATQAQGSGAKVGANYYAFRRTGTGKMYIDRFNATTWSRAAQTSVSNVGLRASDVAYDPTSDIVYGCFYNDEGNGYVFGKIDYATRVRTAIKSLNTQWNAVMASADGQIYAIDMNGDLLKVEKSTGDYTVIGPTGVVPAYQTSATIDIASGRCFWVAMPANAVSSLYEVDLTTAVATKLYDFACNDEIVGMFAESAASDGSVPAAAQELEAIFADNSLSGIVKFKAPAGLNDGSAPEGDLRYKLWMNGELKSEGAVQYDAETEVAISVEKGDKYYIVVAFENEAGRGPIKRIAKFIGNDTPKAPSPELTRENDEFIISWEKVMESVNGGFVDPDNMTFTVRRFPDDIVVAEDLTTTTYRDLVPEVYGQMIPYYYTVFASFEGNAGAAGKTNIYPLGTIVPPYHEGFDDAASMNNFIIIDGNGDGVSWGYSGGMSSAYITNSSQQHDDWLMTAAMYLTAGKKYTLTYEAMASFNPERIEVKLGSAATPEAMTQQLVVPTTLEGDMTLGATPVDFYVEESGTYHIGFHAISDPDAFYLYVDNIAVTCESNPEADAVEPHYLQTFDKSSVLSAFTVIDVNGDGRMWNIDKGEARVGYGENMPMDDWLISPPLALKAGARYNVRLDARTRSESAERFEVKYGTGNKVDAMTETVIAPTDVTTSTYNKYEEFMTVPEDGVYFIGVHGCSDPNSYELYIDNFEVADPVFDDAPGQITDAHVEGADYGELKATVSFKAPTVTVAGNELSSITKIEAFYCGELVESFENPLPGAELSFVGDVPAIGDHTWTITAYNELGAGVPTDVAGYVGVGVPNAPAQVNVAEEGDTGRVTLTWTAPTHDVNGHAVNPEALSYIVVEIINGQQLLLAQNVTGESYTLQAVGAGVQEFKTYGVFPVTAAGTGRGTPSPTIAVGTPDVAPWSESASNGQLSKLLGTIQLAPEASWQMCNDGTYGMFSQDDDNGFFIMTGGNINSAAGIHTGKIDLSQLSRPALSFYTYNIEGQYPDVNEIAVEVAEPGSEYQTVRQYVIDEVCPDYGWQLIRTDLSQFAGKTVCIRIAAITKGYVYTMIDAISITDVAAKDMEAIKIVAPNSVTAGQDAPIKVKIRNIGVEDADDVTIGLKLDGEMLASETLASVAPMEVVEVGFSHRFNALQSAGAYALTAEVTAPGDSEDSNNHAPAATIELVGNDLAPVSNLTGLVVENSTVMLNWDYPEAHEPTVTVEDMEDAEPFAIDELTGWTFIDGDGAENYGFSGISVPGMTTPKAYLVFDASASNFNETFAAHSGSKYLVSVSGQSGPNDDWAISPELSGQSQTVSFFAKTFNPEYGSESFEVLVSSTDTARESFTAVGGSDDVPEEWTEFSYQLPEGSKYFAIRCISDDKFLFMVDDIKYQSLVDYNGPELTGFSVYRNDALADATLTAEQTTYSDEIADSADKEFAYAVTACYAEGESKPQSVKIATSGICDSISDKIDVKAVDGGIEVVGASGLRISIANASGVVMFDSTATDREMVNLPTGVYVVKVGSVKARLHVK